MTNTITSKNLFGMLNINKPKGFTSHDVVGKLRGILKTKQIGHTGTLDPMATGVLPICIGKATKTIQYLETTKAYRADIKLGIVTDTYDMEGEILQKTPITLDIPKIKQLLQEFQGEITQTPPIYSAVHYKGKRLYEYARKNIEITDIPSRVVNVKSIKLVDSYDLNTENPSIVVDIECSGGTYIRSIAYDLGEKLGYGACLGGLIRTESGKFKLDNCYTLSEVEEAVRDENLSEIIINPLDILPLDKIQLDEMLLDRIKNGNSFFIEPETDIKTEMVQLVYENTLVAIAKKENTQIKPSNVFITS